MNRYRYEAADANGNVEAGHVEADSQSAAFANLRGRGLTALLVQIEGNPHTASSHWFTAKLSDNDLAWATRQLASLLGASLPLEAALSATVEQAEKKHIAQTLAAVRADVRGGMRLADALAARGQDMLLARYGQERLDQLPDLVDTGRVAGLIVMGQWSCHDQLNAMARRGLPMAVWGAAVPGTLYPVVGSDNEQGGYLATRHLIEHAPAA